MHLTKFLEWGIDGYYSISAVGEVTLLVMFVCWLKKKKMLYIFEKKGSKKSRFFFLVAGLVATYFYRQLVDAFQLQFHHLIDNKYIFQDLLSTLYSNGQPTFLSTVLSFSLIVVVAPILEEIVLRGIPSFQIPSIIWMLSYQLLSLGSVTWYYRIVILSV